MADIDCRLQRLVAVLELTAEQKETVESLLTVAKQIDQLEATIRAAIATEKRAYPILDRTRYKRSILSTNILRPR